MVSVCCWCSVFSVFGSIAVGCLIAFLVHTSISLEEKECTVTSTELQRNHCVKSSCKEYTRVSVSLRWGCGKTMSCTGTVYEVNKFEDHDEAQTWSNDNYPIGSTTPCFASTESSTAFLEAPDYTAELVSSIVFFSFMAIMILQRIWDKCKATHKHNNERRLKAEREQKRKEKIEEQKRREEEMCDRIMKEKRALKEQREKEGNTKTDDAEEAGVAQEHIVNVKKCHGKRC